MYPPKNKIAVKADINTILQYSAKKKKTKGIALCSVKNPATSSDSASGRSNGVLFVSAKAARKKIKKSGSSGIKKSVLSWASIIEVKLKEPVIIITAKIALLKISS